MPSYSTAAFAALIVLAGGSASLALDGGTLRVNPRNGWRAFEVISVGDNPAGDGSGWYLPGTFDGLGAWLPEADTLRVLINHETSDAAITEVNLDLPSFTAAIESTIQTGLPSTPFVQSARLAYDRFSSDTGETWTATSGLSDTAFSRFCSGQSYAAHTFGPGRGFVDPIYVTGEEVGGGSLLALDVAGRDFYELTGATGANSAGGIGGMPADSWENAALIDTGETDHVALLLSPDGGSQQMKLYVGVKGKDSSGADSDDFLARNGLAYGSYYFLNDGLPSLGAPSDGTFDTTSSGALQSSKLEDVDTSPSDPTRAVLGDQNSGLFTFDFDLVFGDTGFDEAASGFSLTKLLNHTNDEDGAFGDADNVDWSDATTLDGVAYPEGLIYVNEDTGTGNGEIWQTTPDASELTKIGDTAGISGATESSGILDISELVGYRPGSVLLTNNQGSNSSLTTLVSPVAELMTGDFNGDGIVNAADYAVWRETLGQTGANLAADADGDGVVNAEDYEVWQRTFGDRIAPGETVAVPEPTTLAMLIGAILALRGRSRGARCY